MHNSHFKGKKSLSSLPLYWNTEGWRERSGVETVESMTHHLLTMTENEKNIQTKDEDDDKKWERKSRGYYKCSGKKKKQFPISVKIGHSETEKERRERL